MRQRKKISIFLIGIVMGSILLQRGCGASESETSAFETRDVSQFDGPYRYVKPNKDGSIVIKKDDKEYIFEFLGLPQREWLSNRINDFLDGEAYELWIEYDENKMSSRGNLQGYLYYDHERIHHGKSGEILSRGYRMINAYEIWAGTSEFIDDSRTHKHYELLLKEVIKSYREWIVLQKRGVESDKGTIWLGRSTAELESKLTEYEKMLEEYRTKKDKSL